MCWSWSDFLHNSLSGSRWGHNLATSVTTTETLSSARVIAALLASHFNGDFIDKAVIVTLLSLKQQQILSCITTTTTTTTHHLNQMKWFQLLDLRLSGRYNY